MAVSGSLPPDGCPLGVDAGDEGKSGAVTLPPIGAHVAFVFDSLQHAPNNYNGLQEGKGYSTRHARDMERLFLG